jgi:hypothetical protein
MSVLFTSYEVKEDAVAEVEAAIETMFSAIDGERPAGLRYAMCRLPDGVTFVGVVQLEDGAQNPLLGIAAAAEFRAKLGDWVVGEPPAPEPLEVVGSYELFT